MKSNLTYDKAEKGYHKLIVWQRMVELLKLTYRLTKLLPEDERFGLISQMRRAVISVISNFVEGYLKRSIPDKQRFLEMSETSLQELEAQSEACFSLGFWNTIQFNQFDKKRSEVGYLLSRYRMAIH